MSRPLEVGDKVNIILGFFAGHHGEVVCIGGHPVTRYAVNGGSINRPPKLAPTFTADQLQLQEAPPAPAPLRERQYSVTGTDGHLGYVIAKTERGALAKARRAPWVAGRRQLTVEPLLNITTCEHHSQVTPGATERMARCMCGSERPSSERVKLAFFEDRTQVTSCLNCHYDKVAHEPEGVAGNVDPRTVVERGQCTGFVPHGAWAYDTYYCGCRGWD